MSGPEIRKKLIEIALPLEAINAASAREKAIRHGHPSTLHLWWARRPLAACRAVLFSQLVDDPSSWPERFPTEDDQRRERERLHRLIERLVPWEASNDERVLDEARFEIARSLAWGRGEEPPPAKNPEAVRKYLLEHAPPVYDPFCGGGSIPLEAQRLGLRAYGSDLNPVAVMITKALVEFPPKFAGLPPVNPESRKKLANGGAWNAKGAQGLAEDVRYYGRWMRDEAKKRIGHLYPDVELPDGSKATVIAWLWARTVACPNPACRARMPLVGSFFLSTKSGKQAWVEPQIDRALQPPKITFRIASGNPDPERSKQLALGSGYAGKSAGKKAKAAFRCVACGQGPVKGDYIDKEAGAGRMAAMPLAVVAEGKRGRVYLEPVAEEIDAVLRSTHQYICSNKLEKEFPAQECRGTFASNAQGRRYCFKTFADYFTPRQLVALTTFSDLVLEARTKALEDARAAGMAPDPTPLADGGTGAQAYADALAVYLAFGVDKASTRNCSLTIWEPGMGRLAGAMGRQALPMQWAYAETNPLAGAGGDIAGTAVSVAEVIEQVGFGCAVEVSTANAADGPPPPGNTIVVTDPPYYDNISYADLSDFFYVWLRPILRDIAPRELATVLVPKSEELVATPYRFNSKGEAERFFMDGMARAIAKMASATIEAAPVTIYYAFKQAEIEKEGVVSTGWASFLEAILEAGFQVDGTWPMRTEATNALKKSVNALASSIVLVCRKRPAEAPSLTRGEFLRALRAELPAALHTLQEAAIAPVDMAQASIGPGMAVFSRYKEVLEADDRPMSVREALRIINAELDEYLARQEGEVQFLHALCGHLVPAASVRRGKVRRGRGARHRPQRLGPGRGPGGHPRGEGRQRPAPEAGRAVGGLGLVDRPAPDDLGGDTAPDPAARVRG